MEGGRDSSSRLPMLAYIAADVMRLHKLTAVRALTNLHCVQPIRISVLKPLSIGYPSS